MSNDWESRLDRLWSELDATQPDAFVNRMRALCAERPARDAIASFELGGACDSTGHPDQAIPLYRAALDAGLEGIRRRRAVIQLASSLRNLGQISVAIELLQEELSQPSDALDGAVQGFLALALASAGRDREGVAVALAALAATLPRYQRSLARYASDLAKA